MAKVAAIVLAAGRGTRFGAPEDDSKVMARLVGKPLVLLVVEMAVASKASPVLVVTGHAAGRVAKALDGLPVQIVCNPDYMDGMASSIRAGLAALPATTDAALILLADMPFIASTTLDVLIARFEREQVPLDAVVPYGNGKPGNPVLITRRLFADVMELNGDRGARSLIFQPGREVLPVMVDDPGLHVDVDTLEMYVGLDDGGDESI